MNTKNNKRKRASQQKIANAFVELIQTKDIKEVSVTDICTLAKLNRSTFYANYLDIYDLIDTIHDQMIEDFKQLYQHEITYHYNSNDYLKLFYHIKENKLFYKTYFKLQFDEKFDTGIYDRELAKKYYQNKHIDYHCEFFKAGITAIIKMWLNHDCDLSPEDIFDIIKSEYENKK